MTAPEQNLGSVADTVLKNLSAKPNPPGALEQDGILILDDTLAQWAGHPSWEGTAWIRSDETDEHAARERAWQAQEAERFKRQRTIRLNNLLPKRYQAYQLGNLRVHAGNKTAVEAAGRLQAGENLFIHGAAGNGKTHLAVATGWRLLELGHGVEFYGVVDLFSQIRSSFSHQMPENHRPNLLAPDVLILDDLGKVKPTEFVYQEFYAAIEARWANEKTTIFTANHRASEAAKQLSPDGEGAAAILSRMASGHVVEVTGKDERLGARK